MFHFMSATRPFFQIFVALVYTYTTKMLQLTQNIESFVNKTHVYRCKAGKKTEITEYRIILH